MSVNNINAYTNALDIFEKVIQGYPSFKSYIDKWIHYRLTLEVLCNRKMTKCWDCDTNECFMNYYNQLFGGVVVGRGGYSYQIDMETIDPKYNIFIRLDTFFSPATPIEKLLSEFYVEYGNIPNVARRLKSIIDSNQLLPEHRDIVENLIKWAYTPGNMLPIPAGGVSLNQRRWFEQRDSISKHFEGMKAYYSTLANQSKMVRNFRRYRMFYDVFLSYEGYVKALLLEPFVNMDDDDIIDACKSIERRCGLLDESFQSGIKIL